MVFRETPSIRQILSEFGRENSQKGRRAGGVMVTVVLKMRRPPVRQPLAAPGAVVCPISICEIRQVECLKDDNDGDLELYKLYVRIA